ncbi:MAG: HAMP domain-containing protein [Thermomicrobiales bacterium]|nr:HAMP domain-containing protein [Thermomicrobiales bacterium]
MQRRPWRGIRAKLLLSYLVVAAVTVGGLALGSRLAGPTLFDRALHHMDGTGSGGMMGQMNEAMQQSVQNAFDRAMLQALLVGGLTAGVAAVVASIVISRRLTRPITVLAAANRRLARGDLGARVAVDTDDELGELAIRFNDMAAALTDVEQRRMHLIGDIAHELRTPIATLRGYLEGLSDGVVEPSPALWQQLQTETGRLARIVDDLQELSRVESGRAMLTRAPVAVEELIDESIAVLALSFRDKGVILSKAIPAELPRVLADAGRAVQVLVNLLSNALRNTPAGGQVVVSASDDAAAVRITVRDTGIGIPREHLPFLFDRFYRVDPARSRALGGSGIGLAIAKALVEAQDGRIQAESDGLGCGAIFSFTLPVVTGRPGSAGAATTSATS